jgi:hypothetical protein
MVHKKNSKQQPKKATKFAIKSTTTTTRIKSNPSLKVRPHKKDGHNINKSKQQSASIDVLISNNIHPLKNYRRRWRGPSPSKNASDDRTTAPTSVAKVVSTNNISMNAAAMVDRKAIANQRRKGTMKLERSSIYDNLLERDFAATAANRPKRNRQVRHSTKTNDTDHLFNFQPVSFSTIKTTNELIHDTTNTLSTFNFVPSSKFAQEQQSMDEVDDNNIVYTQSDISAQNRIPSNSLAAFLENEKSNEHSDRGNRNNRFQCFHEDDDDDDNNKGANKVDSNQPLFSFAFQPPTFTITSTSELRKQATTTSLSLLRIQDPATNDDDDDIDPDL